MRSLSSSINFYVLFKVRELSSSLMTWAHCQHWVRLLIASLYEEGSYICFWIATLVYCGLSLKICPYQLIFWIEACSTGSEFSPTDLIPMWVVSEALFSLFWASLSSSEFSDLTWEFLSWFSVLRPSLWILIEGSERSLTDSMISESEANALLLSVHLWASFWGVRTGE